MRYRSNHEGSLSLVEKLFIWLIMLAFIGAIVLTFNAIPWLIWNNVVHPITGWRTLGFWQVFFLIWLIGIVGTAFRQSAKGGDTH